MMDQETILRKLIAPVKNDDDELFTHAILPGLFRAAIVKPCKNNKNNGNNDNNCRRKWDGGICSRHSVKRLGRSKVHLRSANLSTADLILIANASGETLSPDQTRPLCPAYRFCVERAVVAAPVAGVTTDQEGSVIGSELSTLRELLEPIKQTALRMKQLSQFKDDESQEICYDQASQTNNYWESEGDTVTEEPCCRVHGMRIAPTSNLDEPVAEEEFNMLGEGDKMSGMDDNVFVRIISKPGMEPGQLVGGPLMDIIQQLVPQMADMRHEKSEEKHKPMMSIVDEYREMQEIGVQYPGYLREKPDTTEEDSLSVQSYEFIKTMDIGCGGEPETRNDDIPYNGEDCYQNDRDVTLDPILLTILKMLRNNQEVYLQKPDAKQTPIEPKSEALRVSVNETTSTQDKSVTCTCGLNVHPERSHSDVKRPSKVEVTNAMSVKSSYFLENLETMTVGPKNQSGDPTCCLKDVSTSTYKISIIKQITSMSQSKMTTSRKRSSSSQCDISPESIRTLTPDVEHRGKRKMESRKPASLKKRDALPETIDELCPCGCGFFLEGDDTCSCGCGELPDSPHRDPKLSGRSVYSIDSMKDSKRSAQLPRLPGRSIYSIDSMADSKISHGKHIKLQESNYVEHCQICGCNEDSRTKDVPLDTLVKLTDYRCENDGRPIKSQKLMRDSRMKIPGNSIVNKLEVLRTDHDKVDERTDLEKEARKLQQKIQCYRKENEYFRKLIQQASNGCQENVDALSRTPPIRATYSGLTTAIEILQAKCRSKDGMIAILAEGLRGVVNYAQIAKNLAAPCLEYTYWDFDQSALYTYLRGTLSKLSVEGSKDTDPPSKKNNKSLSDPNKKNCPPPPPTDFKIETLCKCLFVSWKIPENLSNVAGYRIYVNGNLATNVRSPTRTEAILGFVDPFKPTKLVLHSFDKEDVLSDPVAITYHPDSTKNGNSNQ